MKQQSGSRKASKKTTAPGVRSKTKKGPRAGWPTSRKRSRRESQHGRVKPITSLDLRGYSIIPEASTHSNQGYVRSHKLYEGRPRKGWCGGRAPRCFHPGGAGGRRRQACIEETHVHWPASPSRYRHPPLDPGSTIVETL